MLQLLNHVSDAGSLIARMQNSYRRWRFRIDVADLGYSMLGGRTGLPVEASYKFY
jgi:hypothetical protein